MNSQLFQKVRLFKYLLGTCLITAISSCASGENFSSSASEITSQNTAIVNSVQTTVNQTQPKSQKFQLSLPINIEFCYEMALPICKSVAQRDNNLKLGYRNPPLEGIPSSWNRDTNYWLSLTSNQKNDYLSTALWNFVARLGVSAGVQKLSQAEISSEYQYVITGTKWMIDSLKAGAEPTEILEQFRADERQYGNQEWLIDWRINACIWVAMPAIAPEYLSTFDSAVEYQD